MNSSRPYLLRAIYEWLVDNKKTPHIMVDAQVPDVCVPSEHVNNGKIVLNVAPEATGDLRMGNRVVTFSAGFGDRDHEIYLPISSIEAIYAFENGKGMYFSDEDLEEGSEDSAEGDDSSSGSEGGSTAQKGVSHLKVVK